MNVKRLLIKKQSGFTIPEILVVIAVLVIIGFSLMLYSDPIYSVQTVTDRLLADIRYTQNLAMTQDDKYYISFDSSTAYSIHNSAGVSQSHPYSHTTTQTLINGATFQSTSAFPNGVLVYDKTGRPYLDIALTQPLSGGMAALCINAAGSIGCVYVNPQTGYVE